MEWGQLGVNKNIVGKQISIAKRRFNHGVATHANAEIIYSLDGKYTAFERFIGIDGEHGGLGTVIIKIIADGNEIFDSGRITGFDQA